VPEIWQAAQMTESVYGGFGLDYYGRNGVFLFFPFSDFLAMFLHSIDFFLTCNFFALYD